MNSCSKVCLLALACALIFGSAACSRRNQQETRSESPGHKPGVQAEAPPAKSSPTAPNFPTQKPETPPPSAAQPSAGGGQALGGGAATSNPPASAAPAPVPQNEAARAPEPPPPPKPKSFIVPAGTKINVRTVSAMSTKTAKAGQLFQASLSAPLVVHGVVIAPQNADVDGVVVKSDPGGRVKGVASLALQITSIRSADGQTLRVHTNSFVQQAKSTKKRDALRTGVAAGAGAAIGAIAGGGKGAAIGAGVGGGAGVATNMATRGAAAELPAESVLVFALTNSSAITEARPGSLTKR